MRKKKREILTLIASTGTPSPNYDDYDVVASRAAQDKFWQIETTTLYYVGDYRCDLERDILSTIHCSTQQLKRSNARRFSEALPRRDTFTVSPLFTRQHSEEIIENWNSFFVNSLESN